MTDHHDAPRCPYGHGEMTLIHQNDSDDLPLYVCEHAGNNTACPAVSTPALIAQEYERGRQDERQRADATDAAIAHAENRGGAAAQTAMQDKYVCMKERAEAAEARVRELERALEQELEARDKAQDALLEASGAMGGPEWSSRIPEPDPPDSGDLHRDVPELARQIVAERDRLREALQEVNWCFEAALAEGWDEALSGEPDIERLRAVYQYRIKFAWHAALRALNTAQPTPQGDTCADCGTPLKAKLPEHPGATGYHYCPTKESDDA